MLIDDAALSQLAEVPALHLKALHLQAYGQLNNAGHRHTETHRIPTDSH
jgi:hypothetical protein